MAGPRSEPPMPMFTIVADALAGVARPRAAAHRDSRTPPSDRAPRGRRRRRSSPSTTIDAVRGARNATCSTGPVLGDVDAFAAEHRVDALAQAATPRPAANSSQRLVRDPVLRVIEVEAGRLGHEGVPRTASAANSDRRWTERISSAWTFRARHSGSVVSVRGGTGEK